MSDTETHVSAALALARARWHAVRSGGPGGQHVNTASTAVHLRLAIDDAGLPASWRERLCALGDGRVTAEGNIVIKVQRHRSQALNRQEAYAMLEALLRRVARKPTLRHATRPPAASRRRRLEAKQQRSQRKRLRGKPPIDS